jgi:hypothetical protein
MDNTQNNNVKQFVTSSSESFKFQYLGNLQLTVY